MKDTEMPISRDSALGRLLGADKAPALPKDFADRVVAQTADRAAPLPQARSGNGGVRRWRSGRRLAAGAVIFGALASTAAATGLLDDLPIALPSPEKVWATITGQSDASEPVDPPIERTPAQNEPETIKPVKIEGPIDSPEELEEAFRRVDEVRTNRADTRRERIDRRLDNAIDRRREQGLPVPTPEQEQRLRDRIDRVRERREERVDQRLDERRDEMRERIENGEELSREDFIREQRDAVGRPGRRDRLERFRDMTPEQRRSRIRQIREQRQQGLRELIEEEDASQPPAVGEPDNASGSTEEGNEKI
ncbi:MAG: hypothetical protein AAGK01_06310 [Pseudomonadota bacterium]